MCDNGWDDIDAGVACRQLGFGSSGRAFVSAHFGQGWGFSILDEVTCTGNESTLASCNHNFPILCSHSKDAGVSCTGNPAGNMNFFCFRMKTHYGYICLIGFQ